MQESSASTSSDLEIARLRKEVSSLCKEKEFLQSELDSLDKDKINLVRKCFIITVTTEFNYVLEEFSLRFR